MTDAAHRHPMFYELALAIGNSLDMRDMLEQSLSCYLQELDCSAAGVLAYGGARGESDELEPLHIVPNAFAQSNTYAAISREIPWLFNSHEAVAFLSSLPVEKEVGDNTYHIMALGDRGVFFLVSDNGQIDKSTLEALAPLNDKLATACRACQQRDKLQHREAQSRDDQRRLRAIMNTVQAGVLVIDAETHEIVDANPAALRMLQRRHEDIVGKVCHNYICPTELTKCPITDLGHVVDNSERILLQADGTHVPILKTVTTLDFGGRGMLIETFVDITDRLRTEEELRTAKDAAEAASEAKTAFLTNMSHEIRTPMTAILGFTDLLVEGLDPKCTPPEQLEAAQTIQSNGQHLLALINGILDLSKVEAGAMHAVCRACDPRVVIHDIMALLQRRADSQGIRLSVSFGDRIPDMIWTDPTKLRQILINVVGNAIKFTQFGSVTLEVRHEPTRSRDGDIVVDVTDTGPGMTAEQVEGLFQPFSQVDQSVTRNYGGTGMGLVTSQRFAQLLGGDVEVVKTGPGQGSTFRVRLPAGQQDNTGGKSEPEPRPSARQTEPDRTEAKPLSGLCILLAEDGLDNQRLIAHILRGAGAEVTVVENGKLGADAALEGIHQNRPFDIILMDMQMPVMDGYAATAWLRSQGYKLPIIALTAHAMAGDRERCLEAGCDEYCTKPVNKATLTDMIIQQAAGNQVTTSREDTGVASGSCATSQSTRHPSIPHPVLRGGMGHAPNT